MEFRKVEAATVQMTMIYQICRMLQMVRTLFYIPRFLNTFTYKKCIVQVHILMATHIFTMQVLEARLLNMALTSRWLKSGGNHSNPHTILKFA
jgi:hypothetical protein